jgi:protein-disulfide isomerase
MAGQIGLDVAAWEQCMGDATMQADVQADAMAGAQAGLMGTPTFFLLGAYGDQWVEVQGVGGIAAVINAHQTGAPLPTPGPPVDLH